jgi:hypothetical protein
MMVRVLMRGRLLLQVLWVLLLLLLLLLHLLLVLDIKSAQDSLHQG